MMVSDLFKYNRGDGKRTWHPWCRKCRNDSNRKQQKRWRAENPERAISRARDWRKANPDKLKIYYRRGDLKRHFGITVEEYDRLFANQNGLCAICSAPSRRGRLAVDHDHSSGRVRALLCARCNLLLGYAEDSPEFLLRCASYLHDMRVPRADQ
jgi:hypothetical protein